MQVKRTGLGSFRFKDHLSALPVKNAHKNKALTKVRN